VRGRNTDYFYLEPEILEILRTSEVPMSALGVNFRINNKLEKVVDLNIIKQHLEELVKNDKLLKFEKDDIIHYKVNPRKKF
jgi:hypothetical protein